MYKIFDRSGPKAEPVHRLALTKSYSGISVVLVNELGDIIPGGYVCTITHDGILSVARGVSEDSGLQTENNHIKIRL